MTLLEKCQKWHEAGQFPKIIEALEALGEDGRTPELASELARAYNNEADPNTSEGRLMLHRAIELLEPHEEALGATYLWNFRLGYAYYYLDQEGRALSRFRRAHEAKPEDEDAKEFMEDCLKRVTLPFFRVPFRERTQKAWTAFEGEEAEIRAMMDADKTHERGEEIVDRIERILRLAFEDVSFEVGFNGVKHELILTPEGNRMKLFELVYFRSHAPASVLRHWEITLGRRGTSGNELHAGGVRIGGEDVQAWLEPDDDAFKLSVFCARLADLKAKEEGRAWWMLTTLTDQLLGEIPHMRWINDFELLDAPRAVPGFLLSDLPDKLRELGKGLALDAETLLENSYVGYTREPDPAPDADWRLDVIAGSTACPPLINGYMSADDETMDALHSDGVTAGFIAFSLDGFTGENRTQRIFAFREALEAKLEKACGPDVVRMVGGATGVHFGYVDFMVWDLQPVLFEARAFLEASDVPAASFHVFRREVGSVPLKSPDDRADAGEDDDDEPLDYRPEMAEAFHARIQKWNDDDEYTRCIRALDGVPTQYRDYRHAYALARALENYAVLGDGQYGCPRDKAREALRRAIGVLESVREEGLDRAEWHMRMAYGYQYLTGEEEKAIPYARTWAQLDPEDEDAPCVIRECEKAVEARCKNDGKPVDRKGVFLGFVLLEKAHWDKGRLIADLKAEWDIDVPEEDKDDRKDNGDSLVFEAGDMIAAVSLMHGPVPGGEAEDNAENNYMWPDAVKAAQSHAAHIMVTVLGKETDVRLRGQFFVKLAAACCRQPGVLGVYTSGVVFEPSFYADMAGVMKEGELPLNNWIWFGLHRREGGVCGYTYGMDVFGKEELEVLDADADPLAVREFLVSLAGYVIGSDVTLNDGETIGFSQGDRHRITRSPGVALPDQPTLKVSFEQNEILLDEAAPHLESIREKCLPVDELNAFSHLAIYLRWCIEHDLMSESFCRRWPDIVEAVRTNPAEACLREWLRDKLKGELHASIFNERGADFACYYYGALHEYTPHYTMDVDIHAVSRIGVERNFSDEIQDEAYLFLPFDEDYYREMARIIERRYENWAGQRFDDSTLAPSETAEALMAYLDCECTYFPSMADDDPIMCAYEYAGKNAAHEGFVPMLIAVDETLWECLMLNSDPAHEGDDDHAFDPDAVAAYRQSQLAAPLPDGRMVLEDGMAERRAEAEDDSKDWDTEVVGRMEGGFNNHRFSGYWNSETDMTHPVILARIPVRHPWEVFAHLPFGNWNDCPDTPQLMAVARYWFEKFGAVPAVMTHDELDFALPKPIGRELAVQTALEQYAFCPDMDQNHESVGALADTLRQSKIWYFWWD